MDLLTQAALALIGVSFLTRLTGRSTDEVTEEESANPGEVAQGWKPAGEFPGSVNRWFGVVKRISDQTGVPVALALSVIQQESSGRVGAIGSAGEVGLMQVTDPAAQDVGFDAAPLQPAENIEAGMKYLAEQKERFGNWTDALRAYNAGPGNASRSDSAGREYAEEVLSRAKR